jgi:lactate permease
MYQQIYDPIAPNLVLSAVVALIPIIVLFVLLAGIRMAAQRASLITLATALVIAVVYGMPVGLGLTSTLLGICFGLFPIVWIVSELQIHESSDLAPGCQSKEYPDFGCLQALR